MNRFGNIGKAAEENEKTQVPEDYIDNTLPPTEYPTLVEDKEPEYSYDKKYRSGPNEALVGIFYQTVPFASEYDSEMD